MATQAAAHRQDGVSNPQIGRFYATAQATGALGGKLVGSGGGGYLLFFWDEARRADDARPIRAQGGRAVDCSLERVGMQA